MGNVKKVFINNGVELNFNGEGVQATIWDLNDDICCGGDPIKGIIEVVEGIFSWQDLTFVDDLDFMGYAPVTIAKEEDLLCVY